MAPAFAQSCIGQQLVGGEFQLSGSPEPVLFAMGLGSWQQRANVRNLPGAATDRDIFGCRLPSRPHLLESWLLIFVGPDLSQAPPRSCEPTSPWLHKVLHGDTLQCEAEGFPSLSVRLGFLSLCVWVWGVPWKLSLEFSPCCEG